MTDRRFVCPHWNCTNGCTEYCRAEEVTMQKLKLAGFYVLIILGLVAGGASRWWWGSLW
jgi:hypothetical protein